MQFLASLVTNGHGDMQVDRINQQLLSTTKVKITQELIQQMASDEEVLSDCFSMYIKPDKVPIA